MGGAGLHVNTVIGESDADKTLLCLVSGMIIFVNYEAHSIIYNTYIGRYF